MSDKEDPCKKHQPDRSKDDVDQHQYKGDKEHVRVVLQDLAGQLVVVVTKNRLVLVDYSQPCPDRHVDEYLNDGCRASNVLAAEVNNAQEQGSNTQRKK